MKSIFLFLLLALPFGAYPIEETPFGISEITSVEVELARRKIVREIGNTILTNIPIRVRMTQGYMKISIYTWPDASDIFHPLVILFARDMNKKFSQNVCKYLEQYPNALIGTVYIDYHTILEYTRGQKIKTNLEFQESTECRPGLERYFQEKFANPRN